MIELFKIIKGIYDSTCVSHVDFMELSADLPVTRTRGNNFIDSTNPIIQYNVTTVKLSVSLFLHNDTSVS